MADERYQSSYTGSQIDRAVESVSGLDSRVQALEHQDHFTPSSAQLAAMNSGINSEKVEEISEIQNKQDSLSETQLAAVNSGITSSLVESIPNKQEALSETQMAAVNSGITSSLVESIPNKQEALTENQLAAVNSGIDSTKVAAIAQNTADIANKQNELTIAQMTAVNSGINSEKVSKIDADHSAVQKLYDNGSKNLFKMSQTYLTQTKNGITATYDPVAGTLELDGTYDNQSGCIFELYTGAATAQDKIPAGTYKLTGCKPGGSTSTYRLSLNGISPAVDTGNGCVFTISEPTPLAPRILISGSSPVTFDHDMFNVMVCKEEDYNLSDGFAPHCPTLYEMYKHYRKPLEGKKISFYGDSITTFTGWIPEGNKPFYTGSNCGVRNPYQTWWMRTVQGTGATLCVDQAWSGRTVSNVRDTETDLVGSGAWRQAEVDKLAANGVTPDLIIIKLGINDYNKNVQLGTYDCTTAFPTIPDNGFSTFRESYAVMLHRIMTTYPAAKVYCCTLNQCERTGSTGFPEINSNGDALSEFNDAIKQLAAAFGATVIDHNACGMTYYNMSLYTGDWEASTSKGLHPNSDGMALIAEKTIAALLSDNVTNTAI